MGAADDIQRLAAQRDAGSLTPAEFEAERAKVLGYPPLFLLPAPPPPAAVKGGKGTRILTVLGSIAVALMLLSVADVAYLKVTEEDRWVEQSEQSCSTMLALSGGGSSPEKMTARNIGEIAGSPSFKVTGGTFADRPVLCVNHISSDGNTVSASHIFYADTAKESADRGRCKRHSRFPAHTNVRPQP